MRQADFFLQCGILGIACSFGIKVLYLYVRNQFSLINNSETMKTITLYLASSSDDDLQKDRDVIGDFVVRLNKIYNARGIQIKLDDSALYPTFDQQHIESSNMFVALVHKIGGKTVKDQFDCAEKAFKAKSLPKVYVYFKNFNSESDNDSKELLQIKEHICKELLHYVNTYSSKDHLQLLVVMQLLQVENLSNELEVIHSKVMLHHEEVADLNNVSFTNCNKEYRRLKEAVDEAEIRLQEATAAYNQQSDNNELREKFVAAGNAKKSAEEALEEHLKHLWGIALFFAQTSFENSSERIAKAQQLFEAGHIKEADEVYNENKMREEIEQNLAMQKQITTNIEINIEEFINKAHIHMANTEDVPDPTQRLRESMQNYEDALSYARRCLGYPQEKMADLLSKFAHFARDYNQFNRAKELYEEALKIWNSLADENPAVYRSDLARTLHNLGFLYWKLNQYEEAKEAYLESLEIYRSLADANPAVYRSDLAKTLSNLGALYFILNQYKEAEEAYRKSLEIWRSLADENSAVYRSDLADTLNNLGYLYSDIKQYEEAKEALEKSLKIWRSLADENPAVYRSDLAGALSNLGGLYYEFNQNEEAKEALEKSLEICRSLADENPEGYRENLARTLNNLGDLYSDYKQYKEAEEPYQEALEIRRALADENPAVYRSDLALILNDLGALYGKLNQYEEAKEALEESLEIYRSLAEENPAVYRSDLARTLINLGDLYSNYKQYKEAEEPYQEALEIRRALADENPAVYRSDLALILNNLGVFYGNYNEIKGIKLLKESLGLFELLSDKHPEKFCVDLVTGAYSLSGLYFKINRPKQSKQYARKALLYFEKLNKEEKEEYKNIKERLKKHIKKM